MQKKQEENRGRVLAQFDPVMEYKRIMHDLLAAQQGDRILDAGCGSGDDAFEMARYVGCSGLVVGIDINETQVIRAHERFGNSERPVQFWWEDLHDLAILESRFFNRIFCDRVLGHTLNPALVLTELFRVLKPGGILVCHDADWSELILEGGNESTAKKFICFFWQNAIAHGAIGSMLLAMLEDAGFQNECSQKKVCEFGNVQYALALYRFHRILREMQEQNLVCSKEADLWLEELHEAGNHHRFRTSITSYIVKAVKPL
jgi:SAM-dependent methyltransferase